MAETRSLLARLTARLGVFTALMFVIGPVLAHFQVVAPLAGFVAFGLAGLIALIVTVIGLIAVIRGPSANRQLAWRGLLPALVVVVVFVALASRRGNVPPINDITTDTTNPPQFVTAMTLPDNAGRDMSYPGASFADQQRAGYGEIEPLRLPVPPDAAYARARATARSTATWDVTREDAAAHVIEGVEETYLFRFADDFVIEVRPDGSGSVVHMRSKSRVGRGDVGVNAARIREYFDRLRRAK
jgi:uncharacterized protein (DUF1499 family)